MKLNTSLAILQQSEYQWSYFADWYHQHQGEQLDITPKEWTSKLKLLRLLCNLFFFLPLLFRLKISLFLASFIELPIRKTTEVKAKKKLLLLKKNGLVVVGIAGSFAKTSTKHILNHALSSEHTVLVTPASINTPLGIAQVILNKLTKEHTLFVVELGEYYRGDITQLAKFVEPDYGIVTPIGHQHLERMGSLENIALTIGELIEYFGNDKAKVLVSDQNKDYFTNDLTYYGKDSSSQYQTKLSELSTRGTEFTIITPTDQLSAFMPLFGEHQAVNTLPSVWLANQLGLNEEKIVKKLSTLPFIHRRHEPTFAQNNVLILDNSYNTNPEAMAASLSLLSDLPATQRVIITMGYVELGSESDRLHYQLGKQLANSVDLVGLVTSRKNASVKAGFLENGGDKNNLVVAATPEKAFELLKEKIKPNSIVLFEGGYQELFS